MILKILQYLKGTKNEGGRTLTFNNKVTPLSFLKGRNVFAMYLEFYNKNKLNYAQEDTKKQDGGPTTAAF